MKAACDKDDADGLYNQNEPRALGFVVKLVDKRDNKFKKGALNPGAGSEKPMPFSSRIVINMKLDYSASRTKRISIRNQQLINRK